jgi:hypothetical protein
VVAESSTALAALALDEGDARERAIDYATAERAQRPPARDHVPAGWGWTPTTYGWVEPTARVLLLVRLLRPGDRSTADEAIALLAEREIAGGGWNYGNAEVRGTDLKPYVQPTAMAVLALQGRDDLPILRNGAAWLQERALDERGGLSLALAAVALAANGLPAEEVVEGLATQWGRTRFLGNVAALAWAVLAVGSGAARFEVPS